MLNLRPLVGSYFLGLMLGVSGLTKARELSQGERVMFNVKS